MIKTLIIVLIIIILKLFTYVILEGKAAIQFSYKICHPVRNPRVLTVKEKYHIEKITTKSSYGTDLSGLIISPKQIKGSIIVCHYLGGNKEAVVSMLEPLIEEGYQIVSYDYINHGASSNSLSTKYTLMKDFDLFFKYIQSRKLSMKYGIIGFSMGSTLVIHGMANYPEIITGVIDSGPLMNTEKYFQYVLDSNKINHWLERKLFIWYQLYIAGFRKMERVTKKELAMIRDRHILFIHGTRDNIIGLDDAKQAIEYLKTNDIELWVMEGARHLTGYFLKKEEYIKKIKEVFVAIREDDTFV
ncbi:alpha-beta hydrolase superfamily lysophospholipase [Lachnotalea glycerini]|uniref:Alpha-beta hydrolase superfamily lysophospholipase n=1 Tax=Lachnotalea glycerini TaxID=1763509 RepID=A0A318EWF1_9FIRM|nr:alpha/beta fold hydrolase [Lachnotalea glycerini]PXV95577.1 alpha-beta hydrolase superfamily lysophospholipase [Lachnotalea glycerini]